MPSRPISSPCRGIGAALLLIVLLGGLAGRAVGAVEPYWYDQPYGYVVIDQSLRDALEAFGRNLGVPVVIAKQVGGKAPSNLRADSAGDFLDTLCAHNGLTWFYDGGVLHVTRDEEVEIRQFMADGFEAIELEQALDALGVAGNHLAIRGGADGEPVMVSGPPPYMALVEQWIERRRPAPDVVARGQTRERGVRVFRGSVSEVSNPTGTAQTP
ncbi:type III secretion protein [Pseudomonas sp. PS1]|uniref:Type III secretion protein n=1 Tax=Stutzerimonas marianensis TaxID=2929513 RepID=A0A9X2ATN0_9GAMM|nr:type III secretion protein [Pseudomonas marianensis]